MRWTLAAVVVSCMTMLAAEPAAAQSRHAPAAGAHAAPPPAQGPSRSGTTTTPPPVLPPGRLTAAAAEGGRDEVQLPVTEVRVRRARTADEEQSHRARMRRLCLRAPVEIRRLHRGQMPTWTGSLTDCSGRPTLQSLAALSLLAQPGRVTEMNLPAAVSSLRRLAPGTTYSLADDPNLPRARSRSATTVSLPHDSHTHDPIVEIAPRVRALHPRLVLMLQAVIDHFPGRVVEIVSGYRPGESESRHAHARALDFRLRGVSFEDLRDFVRTIPNAGVGYYPNSVFVHMDVRDVREGPAFWTDYSGPGETPRYRHWPPTDRDIQGEVDWLIDQAERALQGAQEREWSPDAVRNAGAPTAPSAPEPPAAPAPEAP